MRTKERLYCLDNLRTFLIFLVVLVHAGVVYESSGLMGPFWIVDDPSTSNLLVYTYYKMVESLTAKASCIKVPDTLSRC